MNRFFKKVPLLAKLLIIAIFPILFIIFLTLQLYKEKSQNVTDISGYLTRINQSTTLTTLIDQLQRESRYSFDYLLSGNHFLQMQAARPVTDSLLNRLEQHHDKALTDFMDYSFLENIDTTRKKIDQKRFTPDLVLHYYSAAIFRLGTLNSIPLFNNAFLNDEYSDLTCQKILSEMITYLGIISANVYNILYTRKYMVETFFGILGPFEVYKSYEKQLLATAPRETLVRYEAIRQNADLKPMNLYLNSLFSTFKFDSAVNYQQWSQMSNRSLNEMRKFQVTLLNRAESGIKSYYNKERNAKSRTILLLFPFGILVIFLLTYILIIINNSLNELRIAALRIADGETNILLRRESRDAIGSLASSILKIDEKNMELAAAAKKIGKGDFNNTLIPRGTQDVLGNAIIQMQESLKNFTSDLKESREEFRKLADFIPQIIWTATADGYVDYYNKKWYQLTGAQPGYGDQSLITPFHPDDLGKFLTTWYHSVKTGRHYEMEFRLKDETSGEYRWFLGRALPIKDGNGPVSKWFGTATDIHDQKIQNERLEELVVQRTLELRRSNEDLQQFAHVASHDLKEPLRKIRTFTSRLTKEFGADIPEKGKTYMAKMQSSCERMSNLIDSVLSYSVTNATEQPFETIDLDLIIEGIENDLELVILKKNATITHDQLPRITGAPTLIYQLFYNLIHNALKFSRENVSAEIMIRTTPVTAQDLENLPDISKTRNYIKITIQDNGIGFNQEFVGKMFHVFTRLNSREKYEGIGLGLALCKKIVHRHAGVIYAQGEEGSGSAFYIIIPKL
jgi:PAS domain S-box-containing protein